MATIKFIQAAKFSLSGSGASIGDTTLTLQSMAGIDGVNLVTADIGTKGYGTLEPGNGTNEEAISFTGITQNANGTATLTGVSHVLFISPYTATSGITKTHAGASTFILSNDAAFYGNILSYVDTALSSGAIPATTLVNGISTLSVSPASAAQPIVVGDNDPRMLATGTVLYVNSVVNTGIPYAVATGTSTALTVSYASAVSTLASGTYINFLVPTTNASGVTINVNSLGAKTIKKSFSSSLATGELLTGEVASLVYDGTNFQLLSPDSTKSPTVSVFTASGTWTKPAGLKFVLVEGVGAGGGGGGSNNNTPGGGGGGGGSYAKKLITAATLSATETVTVGAGGGGGGGTSTGSTGGVSSFGTSPYISCAGGVGGGGSAGSFQFGGAGGAASTGVDATSPGGDGSSSINVAGANSGSGGASWFGSGAAATNSGGGRTGIALGSGGSGAVNNTGGTGAAGIVIVTEFYN